MNVARINQTSGVTPANQPYQDNREKNLQKQIASLQEKVKNITYNREMSAEEKSDEKKKLQEKMQNLSSKLKQYQIQKQQEENTDRQEAVKKAAEGAAPNSISDSVSGASNDGSDTGQQTDESDKKDSDRSTSASGVILSISNTKDQLSGMHKIRKDLEGRLRTAESDEEKSDLQERINSVSKNMGEKIRKISDTISDNLKDEEVRKEKVKKIQAEQADRMKNINVVVPNGSAKSAADASRKENFMISGDVSVS